MNILPESDAGTAKERLTEIVERNEVTAHFVMREDYYEYYTICGQCRVYEDGFEAVYESNKAFLHVNDGKLKNGFIVLYKIQ